jgi:hypothetical protein
MRRLLMILGFLLLMLAPTPASAHHGMMSSDECGTYTFKADLTKGRTDSLLMRSTHTEGCFTYVYENYAPAGIGEAQGNPWQANYCVTEGQKDVARHFYYYRHLDIDPSSVKVSCGAYSGPD